MKPHPTPLMELLMLLTFLAMGLELPTTLEEITLSVAIEIN
jgi:hypothetical protein